MINTITISRELLQRWIDNTDFFDDLMGKSMSEIDAARKEDDKIIEELRALLAAPVVERQESVALIERARSFVAFVAKCVRKEGEYAPLHRQEMEELDRDLKIYASPPAPVAVLELLRESYESGDRNVFGADLDDRIRACLEKIKEPNQ